MARAPRTALWSARSTSARSARGTVSTTLRSYGFSTAIVSVLATHSPATYIRISTSSLNRLWRRAGGASRSRRTARRASA